MKELIKFATDKILSSLQVTINWTAFRVTSYPIRNTTETENGVVYDMLGKKLSHIGKLEVSARQIENTVIFSVEMENGTDITAIYSFRPENGLQISLCKDVEVKNILSFSNSDDPYWVTPKFISSLNEADPKTQNLVMNIDDKHYHLLPLCGENFRCEISDGIVQLSTGCSGVQNIKGDFLAITVADNPITAVENGYKNSHKAGAVDIPLSSERQYPEVFEGLGWCTWNAFYSDMTSAKIYEKLDEFKENNVPLKWMIIDDGWSSVNGNLLTAFEADNKKFPEGFSECIRKIKTEYGIEKVGVWHSYLGYWYGVDPESKLYEEQKENLILTQPGIAIPAFDEDKAFAFWDKWHSYLKDCGVDFLKIDNQSALSHRAVNFMPTCQAARISHRAIERSVVKNFGGALINCMGMNIENVLSRPITAVSRNSGDFYPGHERGFVKHVIQNSYNAIWHSMIYNCDYDMWWSKHESAVQSGVLRALSGSLIYVSDAIGVTDREAIMPTIEDDGTIIRCDTAARPTTDCVYVDCSKALKLLKIFNRKDDAFAVALYNIGKDEFEKTITDTLDIRDVPGMSADTRYIAYDYFNKVFSEVSAGDKLEVTLEPDKTALYNFYPVFSDDEGEYIMLGNTDKYASIATGEKNKKYLSEIL